MSPLERSGGQSDFPGMVILTFHEKVNGQFTSQAKSRPLRPGQDLSGQSSEPEK